MNEKSGRINHVNQGINILKFIAVTLVIIIHETPPGRFGLIAEGIAAMAVPVFFMISGYYCYGASLDRIRKRTVKVFKLTILANLIYFVWDIAVEALQGESVWIWLRENCTLKRLLVFLLTNESPFRGHLWFLGALLYSYLFLLIFLIYMEKGRGGIAEIIRKNQIKVLFAIAFLLLMMNIVGGEFLTFYGKNIQIPYIRNWLFMGIPFFIMAYCLHSGEELIYGRLNLNALWLISALSILLNVAEVSLMTQSALYITTIFVDITVFITALHYNELNNPLLIRLGGLADKYGLWVYVLQIIVIKNLRWFYAQYGIADNMFVQYMSPLLALVLSFVLAALIPRRQR